jgi:hypothetical protein
MAIQVGQVQKCGGEWQVNSSLVQEIRENHRPAAFICMSLYEEVIATSIPKQYAYVTGQTLIIGLSNICW